MVVRLDLFWSICVLEVVVVGRVRVVLRVWRRKRVGGRGGRGSRGGKVVMGRSRMWEMLVGCCLGFCMFLKILYF